MQEQLMELQQEQLLQQPMERLQEQLLEQSMKKQQEQSFKQTMERLQKQSQPMEWQYDKWWKTKKDAVEVQDERKRKVKGCVVSPWGYTMINTLRKEADLEMIKNTDAFKVVIVEVCETIMMNECKSFII